MLAIIVRTFKKGCADVAHYITIRHMNFSIHQASHIGDRKYNQDCVAYAYSQDALLLVLADGMGGHLQGEVAAALAIETFIESFDKFSASSQPKPQHFLSETMGRAHRRIMALSSDSELHSTSPGSTCVAALIYAGKMYWGHAGDSRLYLLRDGKVIAKSEDHSMVHQWEMWGVITAEEASVHPKRNQITNCLGGMDNMFFCEDGEPVSLVSDDTVLLCSDGLWTPFVDQELLDAFDSQAVAEVVDRLLVDALSREQGHSDNVTGLAIRWGGQEPSHNTAQSVSQVLKIV